MKVTSVHLDSILRSGLNFRYINSTHVSTNIIPRACVKFHKSSTHTCTRMPDDVYNSTRQRHGPVSEVASFNFPPVHVSFYLWNRWNSTALTWNSNIQLWFLASAKGSPVAFAGARNVSYIFFLAVAHFFAVHGISHHSIAVKVILPLVS